jgi:O-antigen ligase
VTALTAVVGSQGQAAPISNAMPMSEPLPERAIGRGALIQGLERAALAVLVLAVAAAPWVTTPMSRGTSNAMAAVVGSGVALWGAALYLERRRPHVPRPLIISVGIVLAYGWFMTLNGHPAPVLGSRFLSQGHLIRWLPGAVDRNVARDAMLPLSAVLMSGVALIDQARKRRVRMMLLVAMAGSGAAMSVVAAISRWGGWSWFATPDDALGGTRFAAFGYHGNAAAYLELALPAALLLTMSTRSPSRRAAAIVAAFLVLVGCATNVSKIGQFLAVLIIVAFCVLAGRRIRWDHGRLNRGRAVLVLLTLVVMGIGVFGARDRWKETPGVVGSDSGRALVWETAARAAQRAPVFGSGPGGFKVLLPDVAARDTPDLEFRWVMTPYAAGHRVVMWMNAHDDALQTLVEWGPLVGSLLGAIVLWPLVCSLRAAKGARGFRPALTAVALGTVYAHSLIDFPLQIFAIQLSVTAWAAIAVGETGPPDHEPPMADITADIDAEQPFFSSV